LHRQLRADKKQFETLSRQKDEDLQTINNEKEKLFEKELDKSKVTMNKIIEESIKDKSTIEKLGQDVRQREKDLKRFKRKNAA